MQQALANKQHPSSVHKVQTDRLYVGNLPSHVSDDSVKQFFSAAAMGAGVATSPGDPVVSMWIAPEGLTKPAMSF